MSLDLTKVDLYSVDILNEFNKEDGDREPSQSLEKALADAQTRTDRNGHVYGIYKLVKYTEVAAPRATVLDIPA